MTERLTIGWIGIGKMGSAMCLRALAAGHSVKLVEPRAENRAAAVAAGGVPVASVAELAQQVDLIFLTLPDDAVLRAVMLDPSNGLARSVSARHTVVEMSTVSPSISREVAAALSARGSDYLRAPISGSTATAASGSLTVLASGPIPAFDRCEAVFRSFSNRMMHVGEGEEGRYLKLVINSMVAASSALLAEALALGRAGNLSTEIMMDAIMQSVVASPLLGYKKDMVVTGDFTPAFGLTQMMKDLDLVLDAANEGGAPTELFLSIRKQYEAAAEAGFGQKDFFALAAVRSHDEKAPER
ncbi:NAD(P)-dependent oxidoreductase [Aquibium sp. LZ166]|uniref:NAD(P)-dependent oxidoreductase n=1 Tax=Aquibium pacificus TaxID=3153579 RepID=A0ABV3SKM5_9HYPH